MRETVKTLRDIPNIGEAMARDLQVLGINQPQQLIGREPRQLYQQLCELTDAWQDPCVLDTLMSAVRYMEGAPKRPRWFYTPERKQRYPFL